MSMSPGQIVPPVPDGGGITAGLQVTLGRVASASEQLAAAVDAASKARQSLPNVLPLSISGIIPTPAATVMANHGGPQPGRQWVVRRWAFSAATDVLNWTGGGIVCLFVGKPYGPGGTSGSVDQWAAVITPPQVQNFSNEQILVLPGQQAFVVVSSNTQAGLAFMSTLTIMDMPQASYTSIVDI
jgi:hypothetical protein